MGIRQTINENPSISIGATAAVIVIAIIVIIWESRSGTPRPGPALQQYYFSDDDGKTFFPDDIGQLAPYKDANGKTAVKALVFKCGSGKEFVGYLERYTPEGRLEAEKTKKSGGPRGRMRNPMGLVEVKKPGAKVWMKSTPENSQQYNDIIMPTCPDGSRNDLVQVFPHAD